MLRKILAILLSAALLVAAVPVSAEENISAAAYVLIEASTGRVLAGENIHERLPIASTTKIMTALIALEQENVQERFTVQADAIRVEGTSMGLKEGDEVSLYDLAGGMLSASGNDAANAAAVRIGGSLDGFAELMNARAAELGMANTHFVTPSGLHDEAHYSTAYDMAILAQEALGNDDFAAICSQERVALYFGSPPYRRTLENHNRLLSSYEGCIGVKTGFTKKAGRCLVSAAERDGVRLICVTLNAPDDWQDHTALLDYGFSQVESRAVLPQVGDVTVPVVGSECEAVRVEVLAPVKAVLSDEEWAKAERTVECMPFLYAPVERGDYIGEAVYSYDGAEVCRVALVAGEDAAAVEKEKSWWERLWDHLR